MARKYSEKTSSKVERTMHEFKHGTLKSGSGGKVKSRKQAIAIGLSQARRAGGKVPPALSHATMKWKPGMSVDEVVRVYISKMRPGTEIDARGIARAVGGVDPMAAEYALESAEEAGLAVTNDGRWFGPPASSGGHARKKSPAQLDREIAEALGGRHAHATKKTAFDANLFAVEIDPAEFDRDRDLPADAHWRKDLTHLAEAEMGRGRTFRRPKHAVYDVIEWTGSRGGIGRLLDWLEAAPGVTRYAEIFE
jgi:hypothetical protein